MNMVLSNSKKGLNLYNKLITDQLSIRILTYTDINFEIPSGLNNEWDINIELGNTQRNVFFQYNVDGTLFGDNKEYMFTLSNQVPILEFTDSNGFARVFDITFDAVNFYRWYQIPANLTSNLSPEFWKLNIGLSGDFEIKKHLVENSNNNIYK
jgi:hypothetical protein